MAWDNKELTKVEGKQKYIPSVMVGVPYKGAFSLDLFKSLYTLKVPPVFDMGFDGGSKPLDLSRNTLVSMCLRGKFEYFLFVDSDVISFDVDILNKLLQKREHIVAATYYSRTNPNVVVGTGKDGKMVIKEDVNGSLLEMDSVGMGCTLIHSNVFHKIGENRKWRCLNTHEEGVLTLNYEEALNNNFECPKCKGILVAKFYDYTHGKYSGDEDDEDGFPIPVCSEDYYFCNVARRNGFIPKLATDLLLFHQASNWLIGHDGFATTSKGATQ